MKILWCQAGADPTQIVTAAQEYGQNRVWSKQGVVKWNRKEKHVRSWKSRNGTGRSRHKELIINVALSPLCSTTAPSS